MANRDTLISQANEFCYYSYKGLALDHAEVHELMAAFAEKVAADLMAENERLRGELERYERMMAAATQIRDATNRNKQLVQWSIEKHGGEWYLYDERGGSHHESPLAAFESRGVTL